MTDDRNESEPTELPGEQPADGADETLQIEELSPPPILVDDNELTTAFDEPTAPDEPTEAIAPVAESPMAPPPPASVPQPAAALHEPAPASDTADQDRWPSKARTAVAILAVLALLGVAGTVIGLVRASSAQDDASATSESLSAAQQRADEAEAALADSQAESAEQAQRIDQLTLERDAAIAARDSLIEQSTAEQERLSGELAEAQEQIQELEDLLVEVAEAFPVPVQANLGVIDTAGTYAVSLQEVTCTGLDDCGSPPSLSEATLTRDSNSTLRLVVPNGLDVPLTAIGGTMFGIADEEFLVPPCGDTPRNSLLTVTLFGDAGEVDIDGSLTLDALGASIIINVPAVADCDGGFVWYRAELTAV